MKRILLLSDTHGFIDPKIEKYTTECDEIWHAGDIGTREALEQLARWKPLRAVYGNVDGHKLRVDCPLDLKFRCEEVTVWMTHIGGYPKRYNQRVRSDLKKLKPRLFICGHSHILKVVYDKELGILHLNPGAVGNHGFHKVKTMLRFTIDASEIKDLEVIELGKRG